MYKTKEEAKNYILPRTNQHDHFVWKYIINWLCDMDKRIHNLEMKAEGIKDGNN